MDVYNKAKLYNSNVSIAKIDVGPKWTFRGVQMLDGKVRVFPEHQIPPSEPYQISNIWRYPAQGQYSNILQNGGQVQFRINEGTGSGRVEKVYLRMIVQNSNSSQNAEYIQAPLWIKTNNWQTPNGELIQQCDGTVLWLSSIGAHDSDGWRYMSELELSNDQYGLSTVIEPLAFQEIQIELIGNWIDTANVFIPWIKGDMFYYPTFQPDNVIRLSGGMLTVVDMSLDMHMSNTDVEEINKVAQVIKKTELNFVVPYVKNQTFTMALQANSSYTLLMNGLTGDVVFMWMLIRNSYVGTDLSSYWPLASFQFTDSGGNPISSNNLITDEMDRNIYYPRHFLGRAAHINNIYHWNFCNEDTAPLSLILLGCKQGAYAFTGNEKLVINTAPAGTNEVLTLQFFAIPTQTGAGQTWNSGSPVVGGFYFIFQTPNGGQKSLLVPANSTNQQVEDAIEGMNFFSGTVTVSGFPLAFTGTASGIGNTGISATATITYGGAYALQPMEQEGYILYAIPSAFQTELTNGAVNYLAPVEINETTSTPGVYGIASGNTYIIDLYAYTTGIVNLKQNGTPSVTYSA